MIPKRKAIKQELVKYLSKNGPTKTREIYDALAKSFSLSSSDLNRKTRDGKSYWEKEVRYAKWSLVREGIIKEPKESGRGIWELVEDEDLSPLICESPAELELAASELGPLRSAPEGQKKPKRIPGSSEAFARDAKVVAWVLQQAEGSCEVCDQKSPFKKDDGSPYLEVHHIKQLADKGSDTVQNAIAACPNCHRELHHGINRDVIKSQVYKKVGRLEFE